MESVGDDGNTSVFHEDHKLFKSDTTIFVTFKSVTSENFGKFSESVNFDVNNDLQEDLKLFKSDTFENYKTFVPVEVQSHRCNFTNLESLSIFRIILDSIILIALANPS